MAIVTNAFVETAKAMAKSWGAPDHPFLTVPHPIANLNEQQLGKIASDIVPNVLRNLLEDSKNEDSF